MNNDDINVIMDDPELSIKLYKRVFVLYLVFLVISTVLLTLFVINAATLSVFWIVGAVLFFVYIFKELFHERTSLAFFFDYLGLMYHLNIKLAEDEKLAEEVLANFPDYYKYRCQDIIEEIHANKN